MLSYYSKVKKKTFKLFKFLDIRPSGLIAENVYSAVRDKKKKAPRDL